MNKEGYLKTDYLMLWNKKRMPFMAHFGQGNVNSKIWFVGSDANFPCEYRTYYYVRDYIAQLEQNHLTEPIASHLLPHPLFHARIFHCLQHCKRAIRDGVWFWVNVFGIDWPGTCQQCGSKNNCDQHGDVMEVLSKVFDSGLIKIKFNESVLGVIYKLWVTGRLFVTEKTYKSTDGKVNIASSISTLCELMDERAPIIVVTLVNGLKRKIDSALKNRNVKTIEFKHPSKFRAEDQVKLEKILIEEICKNKNLSLERDMIQDVMQRKFEIYSYPLLLPSKK